VPWVVRDAVRDINRGAGRRWRELDPLLPEPSDLAAGCGEPFQARRPQRGDGRGGGGARADGENGRPIGYAVCRHQYSPADTLAQTWGTATRYVLTARLREKDASGALDDLLTQWRDHLAAIPQAHEPDTSALLTWPARDVSGVRALLRHGMQPMSVLAIRPVGRAGALPRPAGSGLVVRVAGPADVDAVVEMELGVIRYDEQFGAALPRAHTRVLVRADTQIALAKPQTWTWLAERDGVPIGLAVVQPPGESTWIAGMTCLTPVAYLQTMFVRLGERGKGTGEALVNHIHDELNRHGVTATLLHYAQVNPVSGPFWSRMGYRPLWTSWESRPAAMLR
jgi:GNAT superfamily N-acetyltransferase